MTLYQVAEEISKRLGAIFLRDGNGHRPVYGGTPKFQEDPHWRELESGRTLGVAEEYAASPRHRG